ncbi:hypothetical protein A1359_07200 [Methylomonas lenta]|uniref:Uncharacterized protein n=1 Tax=Methylomonas lenta TaxID=980561 RepID=A0A177NGQ9_9GAMM|nr:hypothetical protein [Methylomonas lenta]OAI16623.1 hypothetical protein A1359_07200 [Methylomonas lenta]
MISTRDLENLPKPDALRSLLQALALLDAILEEEWQYRYYSFNSKWSATEQMGSMRNGSGDDFFAIFDSAGCFLRGFAHESAMTPWRETPPTIWPGVLEEVPPQFENSLKEPAFHMEDTTFCIWSLASDSAWSRGSIEFPANEDDPDGSLWMLSALDGNPTTYQLFAKEYFELDVGLDAITRVFAQEPLSVELLQAFPSSRNLQDVIADAEEIGYPIKP